MTEENKPKYTEHSVYLELQGYYLKIILVVILLGAVCMVGAIFVEPIIDPANAVIQVPESRVNSLPSGITEILPVIADRDLDHRFIVDYPLTSLLDQYDVSFQAETIIGSGKVLFKGIPNAKLGDLRGSHSAGEYRPFVLDTSSEKVKFLSEKNESPKAISPDGSLAVLVRMKSKGGRSIYMYRVIEIGDMSQADVIERVRFEASGGAQFSFALDSTKMTVNDSSGGPTLFFDFITGDNGSSQIFEFDGQEKFSVPDPVGNGIYYLDHKSNTVRRRDLDTGDDVPVIEIEGVRFAITSDGKSIISLGGETRDDLLMQSLFGDETQVLSSNVKEWSVDRAAITVIHRSENIENPPTYSKINLK